MPHPATTLKLPGIFRSLAVIALAGGVASLGGCGTLGRYFTVTASQPSGMYSGRKPSTPPKKATLNETRKQTPSTPAEDAQPTQPVNRDGNAIVARPQRPANQTTTMTEDSSRGTTLAASLYGDVLGAEIPSSSPTTGGLNTENVRRVTFTQAGADFDPFVSRDGRQIVFASTQHRETADIYIKSMFGRTITRLTSSPAHDAMPAMSPDGSHLAFASNRAGTWDIYMMPATGGQPVRLTEDNTQDLHPSWSPDGTQIVFSRLGESSGRWELWVTDIAQPGTLRFIGYGLFPEWCPVVGTGQAGADQILFQRSRERGERTFSVWTLDYDPETGNTGRETEIVSSATHALINPSWSPDGDFVAYASVPADTGAQRTDATKPRKSSLWVIGADGRGHVEVVGGDSVDLMPVWSTRNDLIFVSDRAGVEALWTIELEGPLETAMAQRAPRDGFDDGSADHQPVVGVPTDAEPIPGEN